MGRINATLVSLYLTVQMAADDTGAAVRDAWREATMALRSGQSRLSVLRDTTANVSNIQSAIVLAVTIVVVLIFLPIVTQQVATAQADGNTSSAVSSLLDVLPILFVVGIIGVAVAGMVIAFRASKK